MFRKLILHTLPGILLPVALAGCAVEATETPAEGELDPQEQFQGFGEVDGATQDATNTIHERKGQAAATFNQNQVDTVEAQLRKDKKVREEVPDEVVDAIYQTYQYPDVDPQAIPQAEPTLIPVAMDQAEPLLPPEPIAVAEPLPEPQAQEYIEPPQPPIALIYREPDAGPARVDVPVPQVLPEENPQLFLFGGFETLGEWTRGTGTPVAFELETVDTYAGQGALRVPLGNYVQVQGPEFNTDQLVDATGTLTLQVKVEGQAGNAEWVTGVQLFLNCPMAGLYGGFVGRLEVHPAEMGDYTALPFALPAHFVDVLNRDNTLCDLRIDLSGHNGATYVTLDELAFE